MAEVRWIGNLKGILCYLDQELCSFEIRDRELVGAENISDGKLFPPELAFGGITYGALNDFFNRRTMREGCMFYREHLAAFGMSRMDFDRYIQMNNGNNNLDNYWVKFEGFGAKCFKDICEQNYPVKQEI